MLDPEIKDELRNLFRDELGPKFEQIDTRFGQIDARFEQIDARFDAIDARFESVEESIDSLAQITATGFREMEERFDARIDKLDTKLQNQIDALMSNKADRSELAPLYAQLRNLQPL